MALVSLDLQMPLYVVMVKLRILLTKCMRMVFFCCFFCFFAELWKIKTYSHIVSHVIKTILCLWFCNYWLSNHEGKIPKLTVRFQLKKVEKPIKCFCTNNGERSSLQNWTGLVSLIIDSYSCMQTGIISFPDFKALIVIHLLYMTNSPVDF